MPRTTNGGTNWIINYDGIGFNFYAMDMVNDTLGYIVGSKPSGGFSLLLKTSNTGINWTDMNIGVGLILEDVFFPSKDTGYICSSNSFAPGLWRTTNEGVSWQVSMGSLPLCLFFLNNTTGWTGTMNQILYKTTNGGLNWSNNGNFTEAVFSIFFLNENTGWVGHQFKTSLTTNGGLNWISQNSPYSGMISDIFFYNSSLGWGGIGLPFIYKTRNAGTNWGYQIDSAGSKKILFIDSSRGWTGDNGIAKTTNGGGPITYVGIVSNHNTIPNSYVLYQNYPNPFNSQTKIKFALRKSGYVKLKIYDVLGREKTIWESGSMLGAGNHELSFNAENFSSGVYFYQLTIINEQLAVVYKETRKMVLIK